MLRKPWRCDPDQARAMVSIIRPLVQAVGQQTGMQYKSLCLRVCLDKHWIPERSPVWANMLYRAFHLFDDFDGDAGAHESTTGYQAEPTGPFRLSIDKVSPNKKEETMTTGREGPYEVDLLRGTCTCRFFAGHPWVIYNGEHEAQIIGSELRTEQGQSVFHLKDTKVLHEWFPELDWDRLVPDSGSDPAVDCKHLTASYLVALSCIAQGDGIVDRLPDFTAKYVERMWNVARHFHLFPELK